LAAGAAALPVLACIARAQTYPVRPVRVDLLHVPYRGSGPMLADLVSGQVQMAFDNLPASIQHIRAGKLRALALPTPTRSEALPNIPTVAPVSIPITAIPALSLCDMACSSSLTPLASFSCWRGRSTAGPVQRG